MRDVFNIQPPAWTTQAVCATVDPDSWYPPKGGDTRRAKAICRSCPCIEECLQYALDNRERHGIWGGLSERQRRRLERPLGNPGMPEVDRSKCGTEANARAHHRIGQDPCAACARAAGVARRERNARKAS